MTSRCAGAIKNDATGKFSSLWVFPEERADDVVMSRHCLSAALPHATAPAPGLPRRIQREARVEYCDQRQRRAPKRRQAVIPGNGPIRDDHGQPGRKSERACRCISEESKKHRCYVNDDHAQYRENEKKR